MSSQPQPEFCNSISIWGVWGVRGRIQVSKNELHTHIHLNYIRIEILSCINNNNNNNNNNIV